MNDYLCGLLSLLELTCNLKEAQYGCSQHIPIPSTIKERETLLAHVEESWLKKRSLLTLSFQRTLRSHCIMETDGVVHHEPRIDESTMFLIPSYYSIKDFILKETRVA